MKTVNTAIALVAASLLLSACGKKEEVAAPAADAAPPPAAEPAPAPEAAPAPADETAPPADGEAPPADNAEDAEQSGGDKVRP
jgi:hypothetical protein